MLTNKNALTRETSVYPHTFDCDHLPICSPIKSKFKRPNNNTKTKFFCYSRADFDCLGGSPSHVPCDSFISGYSSALFSRSSAHCNGKAHLNDKVKTKRQNTLVWFPVTDKDVMKLVRKKKRY